MNQFREQGPEASPDGQLDEVSNLIEIRSREPETAESFWDRHPTAKRYAKFGAMAGPFGLALTFLADVAPHVAGEVRRATAGLGQFGD